MAPTGGEIYAEGRTFSPEEVSLPIYWHILQLSGYHSNDWGCL